MHIPGLNAVQAQRTGFITAPNGTIMCHLYDVTDTDKLTDTPTPGETPVLNIIRTKHGSCILPELALQHATETRDTELSAQQAAQPSTTVNTDTPRPESNAKLTAFTDTFIEELSVIYQQIAPSNKIKPIKGQYKPAYNALHDHEEYILRTLIGCVQENVQLPQTFTSHVLANAHTYTTTDTNARKDTTITEKKFKHFESGIYTDQGLRYLPNPETVQSVTVTLSTVTDAQAIIENNAGEKTEEHVSNASLWVNIDTGDTTREYPVAVADNGVVSLISHEPTYGNQDMNEVTGAVKTQLTNAITPTTDVDTTMFTDATARIINTLQNANLTGTRTKEYLQQALTNTPQHGDTA